MSQAVMYAERRALSSKRYMWSKNATILFGGLPSSKSGVYEAHVLFLPREAMLSAVYAVVVCLCVCVSVRLSVTLRYCNKTAKRRITQTTPHDSPMTLVF